MNPRQPQLRTALVLALVSIFATALLFPYLLALQPAALELASAASGLPVAVIIAAQSLQAGVILFLLAWAGLKLGAPLGLGAPWLAAWLYRQPIPVAPTWTQGALLGALAGGLVLVTIALFGAPIEESTPTAQATLAFAAKGLLASPYGAVVEEVSMRAFVMGGLAWLLSRLCGGQPRAWVMIAAIVIAALAFGAGHLPMAAQLAPLTLGVVTRVIVYNTLPGLIFGWLYWKRGLEHAMLAHFCADLVLHVVAPLASLGA